MATRIEDLQEHARQAAVKLADVANIHLPALIEFLGDVAKNPLVTSVEASAGREVTGDAQAVLNGLTTLFSAVGKASSPVISGSAGN
jgi:hypothetical protein